MLRLELVTRAITVRLDDDDQAALERQAGELRIRPDTLARILVHTRLSETVRDGRRETARAALDRLVRRSQQRAPGDAVALVAEARRARGR